METPQILPPGVQPDPGLCWLRKPLKSGMGYAIEPWKSTVLDDPDYVVQRWVEVKEPPKPAHAADGASLRSRRSFCKLHYCRDEEQSDKR
jgi:hypothetical protein